MLSGSVLGKLYIWWADAKLFALLSSVCGAFSRAWGHSFARRALCFSKLRLWFANSLAARAVNWCAAFVLRVFALPARESRILSACGATALLRFDVLFGGFVCLMFCVPHSAWHNQLALAAAIVFFVLMMLLSAAGKRRAFRPSDFGLPALIFAAALCASLLFSLDVSDSLRVLGFFAAAYLLMFTAGTAADSRSSLKALLCWIYAAVLIASLYALYQRAAGVSVNAAQIDLILNPGVPGRVYSTLDNPNNFAEFLVLFTPLCAVPALNAKKAVHRLLLALGLVLPLAALLMTYSRSGWLSAALTILIFVYFTDRRLVPWLFVLGFLALPFLPAPVMVRLSNLFNTSDTSADYRLRIWQTAARLLGDQRRWLTGIGLGPSTLAKQIELFADDYVLAGIVHSQMLYIELLLETGLLGLLSFLWMMAGSVSSAAGRIRNTEDRLVRGTLAACVASFAGMALFGVFEYIWFYPRVLFAFFLLLGIMKAAVSLSRKEAA